jgi:hypothetical protein
MEEFGGLLLLIGVGGICISLAELLCGMLDLPRVHASRDEYDEVQS